MSTSKKTKKPKVFVIMPFNDEFQIIYNELFKSILSKSYDVFTANLQNQQNIIKDIVVSIAQSDLVIADLTLENGNVYYELGLAHALGKKVIQLTQDRESIPFDLRPYRTIKYGTHIGDLKEFRKELAAVAKGALDGSLEFGNPVLDFLPTETSEENFTISDNVASNRVRQVVITELTPDVDLVSDKREFLDHLADIEETFEILNPILVQIAEQLADMGAYATAKTKALEDGRNMSGSKGAFHRLNIVKDMADKLVEYSKFLAQKNNEYEEAWQRIDNSIEYVVNYPKFSTPDERRALIQLMAALSSLDKATISGRQGLATLRDTMSGLQGTQQNLTVAARTVEAELARLISNIDRTRASITRALHVGRVKLNLAGDFDFTEENIRHL